MNIFTQTISEDYLEDLHGKVTTVTGGSESFSFLTSCQNVLTVRVNTGIGYIAIQFLAQKRAKVRYAPFDASFGSLRIGSAHQVYVAVRDEGRVRAVIQWLKGPMGALNDCTSISRTLVLPTKQETSSFSWKIGWIFLVSSL